MPLFRRLPTAGCDHFSSRPELAVGGAVVHARAGADGDRSRRRGRERNCRLHHRHPRDQRRRHIHGAVGTVVDLELHPVVVELARHPHVEVHRARHHRADGLQIAAWRSLIAPALAACTKPPPSSVCAASLTTVQGKKASVEKPGGRLPASKSSRARPGNRIHAIHAVSAPSASTKSFEYVQRKRCVPAGRPDVVQRQTCRAIGGREQDRRAHLRSASVDAHAIAEATVALGAPRLQLLLTTSVGSPRT